MTPESSSEYYPKRQDSHFELTRPDSSFLEYFRQSLIYGNPGSAATPFNPYSTSVTRPGNASFTNANTRATTLKYPLSLFAEMQDLPSPDALHNLQCDFQNRIGPSLPFVSSVPSLKSSEGKPPFYLMLCKALFASRVWPDADQPRSTRELWRACTLLLTGAVEVDNRLGTMIEWLAASTLLVAAGSMSTDSRAWRQTNVINGYMHATLFRRDFVISSSVTGLAATKAEIRALRCFYLIVDTIRSIHLQKPSTVDPTWTTELGHNKEYNINQLISGLSFEVPAAPLALPTEEVILVLVKILSNVNTLLCSFGPLTSKADAFQAAALKLRSDGELSLEQKTGPNTNRNNVRFPAAHPFNATYDLHVPFTSDSEYSIMKGAFEQALKPWSRYNVHSTSPNHCSSNETDHLTSSLASFAGLLLESGPAIYAVPSLVGYSLGTLYTIPESLPRPCMPHLTGIHFSDKAVRFSVAILEAVEIIRRADKHRKPANGRIPPMWFPLALFYRSLVIWSRSLDDTVENKLSHMVVSPRKVLHDFYIELFEMKGEWECAQQMAAIVKTLIETKL